jgi:hypothetical protein
METELIIEVRVRDIEEMIDDEHGPLPGAY